MTTRPRTGPEPVALSARQCLHVARALEVMSARYADPLTLSVIAKSVGLERTYFATLFRRHTGRTVHDWLVETRVRHAFQLLEAGDKVEVVALSVGFRSRAAFNRAFSRATGHSPSRWRYLAHSS